ncbi:DUF2634 domain-containing protein [Paenibacillus algorifonticola]|uniref:DUF2634 domain-containing protein n=1 Tax=Paenibacillus algorifonticola TaxID=684063 RepID=UPI003D2A2BCF
MALKPLSSTSDRVITADVTPEPSRTYDIFEQQLTAIIDGESALRQFIRKALVTARDQHIIYDTDYGNEITSLIGQNVNNELFDAEITRIIREAIIYDDRILSVDDFVIQRSADACFITFSVEAINGDIITEGVTL